MVIIKEKMKHTKIVATMGPSSISSEIIEQLILSGVNVFRLNFSHGTHQFHQDNAHNIRTVANKLNSAIAVMCDLQGPKIRISKFIDGQITLVEGDKFILDTSLNELGDQTIVGVDYKFLHQDVKINDTLLLDDGKISLKVLSIKDQQIICQIINGGLLSDNKGINKLGGGLTAPSLTAKDLEDIKIAALINTDYLAISFPKSSADMHMAKELFKTNGGKGLVIAKIERCEAVIAQNEIIASCDGIMVARGDLAVEVGDAQVPFIQKQLIKNARAANKLVITATQMMESMINSPIPTRAEVSDVANAVLDGTDAVMLSAETATGNYPVHAVLAMARTCEQAEKTQEIKLDLQFLGRVFTRIDQAIAMSTLFAAYHMKVRAIVSLSESGATPLWMSRLNTGIPIFALTPYPEVRNKMALYREVFPMIFTEYATAPEQLLHLIEKFLLQQNLITNNDLIVVTFGDKMGNIGGTNTLKILQVSSAQ